MVPESKKYFNYAKRQIFSRKKLNFLILYVTSRCNFNCRTCFFHASLNRDDDLSFEEFDKISKNLGHFSILLIGGGEPFLRPDLEAICALFVERNKINTLYIPTNGFLTDRILIATEALLKKFPGITLAVNPSLDGTKDYHENTRRVTGSFEQTVKTIAGLAALKQKYENFQIIVNSVIHRQNPEDLKKLAFYLRQFNIDYHAFEVLRGDPRDKTLPPAELAEIKKIHDFILANRQWYLAHRAGRSGIFNFLNQAAVIGHLGYTQSLKEKTLAGKKWPMPCAAGRSIAVVYPDGAVGLCELAPSVGNLKDYEYSLTKVLESQAAKKQLAQIKEKRCDCTHICFINSSLAADPKTIFQIPYFYLKYRRKKHEV